MCRYLKVIRLQLKLVIAGENLEDASAASAAGESEVASEERRAVLFKATETFLEAAPQLFLQVYIAYKRDPNDNSNWTRDFFVASVVISFSHTPKKVLPSLVSMTLSLLSLMKTSLELQEVDRAENAVSEPRHANVYLLTSLFWFSSTVVFRR